MKTVVLRSVGISYFLVALGFTLGVSEAREGAWVYVGINAFTCLCAVFNAYYQGKNKVYREMNKW